jgi:undecaprenol kinase
MDSAKRNKNKSRGLGGILVSAGYSMDGIKYTIKNERSFKLILMAILAALFLGVIFNVSSYEWLMLFVIIALIIGTELINTAIEATIDLVTTEHHPLAKIAKDAGSGAVFVYSIIAFIMGLVIFIPKLIVFLGNR